MSNLNPMLIITSDENLIEEASIRQSSDTQMIELNGRQFNNSIDLQFLAQLSQFNHENDQMYKRVLDYPQTYRLKMNKTSRKSLHMYCLICGDRATGFNYDVLTCASCKAFFRRNAQHNPDKVRCLNGENNCLISTEILRKCQRCRLIKCFQMGMRKDFILSEEEKQKRRERIELNRQLSFQVYTKETKQLSEKDWSIIEHLQSTYLLIFENRTNIKGFFESSDHDSALINWSQFVSDKAIKLINFLRQIDLFEHLNNDDKFILIKYNLLVLYLIRQSLFYNPLTGRFDRCTTINQEDLLKRRQFWQLCYGASGLRERFKDIIHLFTITIENDNRLIYLILIILIFSKGLSMNENEPILNDSINIFRCQSFYLNLLWKYLITKQGELLTIKQFSQLIRYIHQIQSYTKDFRDFFHNEIITSRNALENFAPLMQSVLNIT